MCSIGGSRWQKAPFVLRTFPPRAGETWHLLDISPLIGETLYSLRVEVDGPE